MEPKRSLIEIIKKNKLSITENPFGINRLWPKSYIELFYNDFCKALYKKVKSPNILEVNQTNDLNLKLWTYFFKEPKIKNISSENIITNNFNEILKYDFVIIQSKDIDNDLIIISKLILLLKHNGLIIIENIGRDKKKVSKIYSNFFRNNYLEIYDFRINRFILRNCILVINSRNKSIKFLKKLKSFVMLYRFQISELLISLYLFIIKKLKL